MPHQRLIFIWCLIAVFFFCPSRLYSDFLEKKKVELGKAAIDFELADARGKTYRLSDFKGKIVVLDFWSSRCPISKRYEERFKMLVHDYLPKGVIFLGIDSNKNEPGDEVVEVARERGVIFPILLDPGNQVADLYGAATTPHVFVMDREGTLRYEGAMDNEGWVPKPQGMLKKYLRPVLDRLLEGKDPEIQSTPPFGCTIKRVEES